MYHLTNDTSTLSVTDTADAFATVLSLGTLFLYCADVPTWIRVSPEGTAAAAEAGSTLVPALCQLAFRGDGVNVVMSVVRAGDTNGLASLTRVIG